MFIKYGLILIVIIGLTQWVTYIRLKNSMNQFYFETEGQSLKVLKWYYVVIFIVLASLISIAMVVVEGDEKNSITEEGIKEQVTKMDEEKKGIEKVEKVGAISIKSKFSKGFGNYLTEGDIKYQQDYKVRLKGGKEIRVNGKIVNMGESKEKAYIGYKELQKQETTNRELRSGKYEVKIYVTKDFIRKGGYKDGAK